MAPGMAASQRRCHRRNPPSFHTSPWAKTTLRGMAVAKGSEGKRRFADAAVGIPAGSESWTRSCESWASPLADPLSAGKGHFTGKPVLLIHDTQTSKLHGVFTHAHAPVIRRHRQTRQRAPIFTPPPAPSFSLSLSLSLSPGLSPRTPDSDRTDELVDETVGEEEREGVDRVGEARSELSGVGEEEERTLLRLDPERRRDRGLKFPMEGRERETRSNVCTEAISMS